MKEHLDHGLLSAQVLDALHLDPTIVATILER